MLAQENVEELLPLPADFTGEGELFMLRVRGDSMIEAGILDGDYVVVPASRPPPTTATSSSPASPATRRRSRPITRKAGKVTLLPANARLEPMVFDAADVRVYGKVVTVLRRL